MFSSKRRIVFCLLIIFIALAPAYWLSQLNFDALEVKMPQPPPMKPTKPVSVLSEPEAIEETMPKQDLAAVAKIRASFATGDYGHCWELLLQFASQRGRSSVFQDWLRRQRVTILTALGWLKLKTGRCDQAIDYLKKAERINPSLEVAKGLAYCYFMNHSLNAAEENIQWIRKNSTQPDPELLFIYSEVLESKGHYAEAVKILEELSKLRADDPNLKQRLSGMREKAKKASLFQTINTPYFSLTYEEDIHRDIAEKTLDLLERSLDDLIVSYRFREPKKPIEVALYPEQDFQSFNPDSPLWAEALFNGRIRVPIHQSHDLLRLQTALRHELVHALFSQMTGSRPVPNWFDEGVAQLASNCNKSCVPFRFDLNSGDFLSESNFQHPFVGYKEMMAQQVYRQSLYLVLTIDYRYKSGLQTIIENIRIDSALDSNALLQQVGTNFSDLRKNAEDLWQRRHTFAEP